MNEKGFTLLEILLAVGAISILAGIVIVAINPGKQLANARNTTRLVDANTIADAVYQYVLDHDYELPGGISSSTYTMLGTDSGGCAISCGAQTDTNWNGNKTYTDQTAADFALGSANNVIYDNAGGLRIGSGGSGEFISRAFDSGEAGTTWSTLAWTPSFPALKELPNNGSAETGYTDGINMTGNILLLHLNENAGSVSFTDTSGASNSATCGGSVCPTMGVDGVFKTVGRFDGLNDYISVADTNALKFTGGEMTISAWISPDQTETYGRIISKPWNGNGEYNYMLSVYGPNPPLYVNFCIVNWFCLDSPRLVARGTWNHVAVTAGSSVIKIFLNGVEVAARQYAITDWVPTYGDKNVPLTIGTLFPYGFSWDSGHSGFSFKGWIDEVAMFNRVLSPTEISNLFKRGISSLKFQTRSCSDSGCANANFTGPDSSGNSYYSEIVNSSLSPPSFTISNVSANRYFQYRAVWETDRAGVWPRLLSATVSANVPAPVDAASENTADACLDLNAALVSGGYLSALPSDPKQGNTQKTYYAVKTGANGKIMVKSCRSELSQDITVTR